jgi:hypothetical protein
MPAGAIEAVFAAEIGPKIVNFGGHSASQNGKRPMPARAGLSAAGRGRASGGPRMGRSPQSVINAAAAARRLAGRQGCDGKPACRW